MSPALQLGLDGLNDAILRRPGLALHQNGSTTLVVLLFLALFLNFQRFQFSQDLCAFCCGFVTVEDLRKRTDKCPTKSSKRQRDERHKRVKSEELMKRLMATGVR